MEKFDSCFRYVLRFVKHKYNCDDYDVRKINYDFIIELDHYLRINGLSNNTAVKYMQSFKKIIKIALAKGYILINPFAEYKVKLETVEREFLTDDEIYRIQNLTDLKRSLAESSMFAPAKVKLSLFITTPFSTVGSCAKRIQLKLNKNNNKVTAFIFLKSLY